MHTRLPPLEAVNGGSPEEFRAAVRLLFELAPPLERGLWQRRPYASYAALIDAARDVLGSLDEPWLVAVVNAHPRIGADPAALRQTSPLSFREQGYDRSNAAAAADAGLAASLAELNAAYEARFGFRFVVFVAGRPRSEIVEVMRARLNGSNTRDEEIETARAAILSIARDRLRRLSPRDG